MTHTDTDETHEDQDKFAAFVGTGSRAAKAGAQARHRALLQGGPAGAPPDLEGRIVRAAAPGALLGGAARLAEGARSDLAREASRHAANAAAVEVALEAERRAKAERDRRRAWLAAAQPPDRITPRQDVVDGVSPGPSGWESLVARAQAEAGRLPDGQAPLAASYEPDPEYNGASPDEVLVARIER